MKLNEYLDKNEITQTAFADSLKVSQGLVWQWLNGHRPVAAKKALAIERLTAGQVSRYDLRPDVYPRESKTTN